MSDSLGVSILPSVGNGPLKLQTSAGQRLLRRMSFVRGSLRAWLVESPQELPSEFGKSAPRIDSQCVYGVFGHARLPCLLATVAELPKIVRGRVLVGSPVDETGWLSPARSCGRRCEF